MIDSHAKIRADLEEQIRDAVRRIDDAYRPQIERAHERGWSRGLDALIRRRAYDVERCTKALVVEYAKLPPPPIVIRADQLPADMRERFGL